MTCTRINFVYFRHNRAPVMIIMLSMFGESRFIIFRIFCCSFTLSVSILLQLRSLKNNKYSKLNVFSIATIDRLCKHMHINQNLNEFNPFLRAHEMRANLRCGKNIFIMIILLNILNYNKHLCRQNINVFSLSPSLLLRIHNNTHKKINETQRMPFRISFGFHCAS